jgi:hypothetical protein
MGRSMKDKHAIAEQFELNGLRVVFGGNGPRNNDEVLK